MHKSILAPWVNFLTALIIWGYTCNHQPAALVNPLKAFMKRYLHAPVLFFLLLFMCAACKKNGNNNSIKAPNASEANLAIGIKKDASLATVFQSLNTLGFDIRQMNGFTYNVGIAPGGVANLISLFNQKPYVNTGAWKATAYTIYYFAPEQCTRIANNYFNMNHANQADMLSLIDSLNLVDRFSETKNMYLSVPDATASYWKNELLSFPFVKWTETFDQTCLSFQQATVLSANVPVAGAANQPIAIPIRFDVINGCGEAGNFTLSQDGNTHTITVNAKYEGCVCTQAIRTIETTYLFTATTTGEHTIRFLQPDGQFLTYSIHIQ